MFFLPYQSTISVFSPINPGVLCRSEKMVTTSEQLLGGEVYHYHTKLMTKPPHTGWEQFWHQDYGYWSVTSTRKVDQTWIPNEPKCTEFLI